MVQLQLAALLVGLLAASLLAIASNLRRFRGPVVLGHVLALGLSASTVLTVLYGLLGYFEGRVNSWRLFKLVAAGLQALGMSVQILMGYGLLTRLAIIAYVRFFVGLGPAGSGLPWLYIPSGVALLVYGLVSLQKLRITGLVVLSAIILAVHLLRDLYMLHWYVGLGPVVDFPTKMGHRLSSWSNFKCYIQVKWPIWLQQIHELTDYSLDGAHELFQISKVWAIEAWYRVLALKAEAVTWGLESHGHIQSLLELRPTWSLDELNVMAKTLTTKWHLSKYNLNKVAIRAQTVLSHFGITLDNAAKLFTEIKSETVTTIVEAWSALPELEPRSMLYAAEAVLALLVTVGIIWAAFKTLLPEPEQAPSDKPAVPEQYHQIESSKRRT